MSKQLFEDLRKLAGETRDRKLAEVREEYSNAIADIAAMEHRLIGKPVAVRPKDKTDASLVDLVAAVMPGDRAVTNDDVCGLLRVADPNRQFNAPTIRATLHRLVKEGTVKRISNPQAGQKVRYCLPEFGAEPVRSLADWAAEALKNAKNPMKPVEIVVAMVEQGFELHCEPSKAVHDVVRAMQNSGYFRETSGEWAVFEV